MNRLKKKLSSGKKKAFDIVMTKKLLLCEEVFNMIIMNNLFFEQVST
jgi:hypothetical protein